MTLGKNKKNTSMDKAMRHWQAFPENFCKDVLRWEPWAKQLEVLHSLRENKETYVKSCNAAGKSWLAAGIVLWWLFTRRGKVVTTAPTWRQVREILWANIGAQCEKAPSLGVKPLQTKLQLASDWYAVGLSTKVPDKFQGYHGNVLVVVDEASGVNDENIWAAIDGNLTDDKNDRLLAIGNPLDPDSIFARKFKIPQRKGVNKHITISAFDVPNVIHNDSIIPGLVSRGWVEQKRYEWGEDSPLYQARVLGEFPKMGTAALFPMHWLERAFDYNARGYYEPTSDGDGVEWVEGLPDVSGELSSLGLDVSGSGMDNNAMCMMTGHKLQAIQGWPGVDSSNILGDDDERHNTPTFFDWARLYRPKVGIIDALGLGDPIYQYAKKYLRNNKQDYPGFRIRAFRASNSPMNKKKFANYKAESYWRVRNLLQENRLDLSQVQPDMREILQRQASAIRWRTSPQGLIVIEDKDKMRAREGFSPDELESMIMAIAGLTKYRMDNDATAGFDYSSSNEDEQDVAAFQYDFNQYYGELV